MASCEALRDNSRVLVLLLLEIQVVGVADALTVAGSTSVTLTPLV